MKLNELRSLVQEVIKEQRELKGDRLYFQFLGGSFDTYGLIRFLKPEEKAELDHIATIIEPYGLSPYKLYRMTSEGIGGYYEETLSKVLSGEEPDPGDLEYLGITSDNLKKLVSMHKKEVIDDFKKIIANVKDRKPEGYDKKVAASVRRGGSLD